MDNNGSQDFSAMLGHIIVCGLSGTSLRITEELELRYGGPAAVSGNASPGYVMISVHEDEYEKVRDRFPHMRFLLGDATEDAVLRLAGVAGAAGIFPVLPSNKDNLFITFTAKQINPSIRVVARTSDLEGMGQKLLRAGADSVVSPSFIGGMRLASEMARPNVTAFLDELLRGGTHNRHIVEARLGADSPFCGQSLAALALRQKYHVLVIAVVPQGNGGTLYNPRGGTIVRPGDVLVLFGESGRLDELAAIISGPSPRS